MRVVLDLEWIQARTLVNCLRAPGEHDIAVPGCGNGSQAWRASKHQGCGVHDVRSRYHELAEMIMDQIGEEEPA